MSAFDAPVTVAEARAEQCPSCGALAGQPCRYKADGFVFAPGVRPRQVKRKGKPMKGRMHLARHGVVKRKRVLQYKREHRHLGARADLRAAVDAMRAWDLEEYRQLRAWWAEFGGIIAYADRVEAP